MDSRDAIVELDPVGSDIDLAGRGGAKGSAVRTLPASMPAAWGFLACSGRSPSCHGRFAPSSIIGCPRVIVSLSDNALRSMGNEALLFAHSLRTSTSSCTVPEVGTAYYSSSCQSGDYEDMTAAVRVSVIRPFLFTFTLQDDVARSARAPRPTPRSPGAVVVVSWTSGRIHAIVLLTRPRESH